LRFYQRGAFNAIGVRVGRPNSKRVHFVSSIKQSTRTYHVVVAVDAYRSISTRRLILDERTSFTRFDSDHLGYRHRNRSPPRRSHRADAVPPSSIDSWVLSSLTKTKHRRACRSTSRILRGVLSTSRQRIATSSATSPNTCASGCACWGGADPHGGGGLNGRGASRNHELSRKS
jgi:hypothetical protein